MNNIRTVFQFGGRYLRPYWSRFVAGILLGVVFGLSNGSFVWATKTLIDRFEPPAKRAAAAAARHEAAAPAKLPGAWAQRAEAWQRRLGETLDRWLPGVGLELDWRRMLGGLLFLPLLVTLRSGADYGNRYCMGWVSERVINDMRLDLLQRLSTLSLDFFHRSTTGDLLTRIQTDTAALLRCLQHGSANLVKESVSLLGVLGALLWIDWQLTLLAMVLLPLCLYPLLVLGRKARRASRASRRAFVEQAAQLVELLGGIRVIKAYGLEGRQLARYREWSRALVHHGMKGVQARELVNPLIEIISMFGLGALVIYIFKTQTSVGEFVGFLTGLMLFFLPIKKLSEVHIQFEQASVGVQRLADIFREQPTVREPANPKPLPEFRSELRFENVSFGYAPDRPVIRDFSLVIPRGQKVGVAGASGSGKSTLVNLLFRFYDPGAGRITMDGLDVRELATADLRRQMALVSQDIILFDQSVAENIALGKPGATRAEIEAAARAASAHEFIAQMPQGYDTRVGERGVTLSGGQRQRLAIARAFIRNAPVLVLDEATASLDSQAEAEVQSAIDRLEENRTVLCVAHRLSTLAGLDRVIVLHEGRMVESGTFAELLRAGGRFAEMAARQGIAPRSSRRPAG